MFGKYKPDATSDFKKADTYIKATTKVQGDVLFKGTLYFDGTLKGNFMAEEDKKNMLVLGKNAIIKGDIRAKDLVVFGEITGNLHSTGVITLMPGSKTRGDIYYQDIDMRHGASVSGRFHHVKSKTPTMQDKQHMDKRHGASASSGRFHHAKSKEPTMQDKQHTDVSKEKADGK